MSTAHASTAAPTVLTFARRAAAEPPVMQWLVLAGLAVGVVARVIPDYDNGNFANLIFALFTLPYGLAILSARFVLAVERAVLSEQAAQTTHAGQAARADAVASRSV